MSTQRVSRAERKRVTRSAIVEAAAWLFARRGIAPTSLDAIAGRVGVTKGAVYANFTSKRELVEAVAVVYSAPADFTPLLRVDLPLADRLRHFGRGLARLLQGSTRQVILLDFEYQVYAKRNRRWGDEARAALERDLAELAGQFDAVNRARGETLPLGAKAFLRALVTVGRGAIWQLALDPNADTASALETLFGLLAGH